MSEDYQNTQEEKSLGQRKRMSPFGVAAWTAAGVLLIALQIAVSWWATLTEKDPDLDETIQFGETGKEVTYPEVASRITPEGLAQHIRALSAIPTRVTGTDGCDEAARYVYDQFEALGVGEPQVQLYPITAPVTERAGLETPAGDFPLYPMWPNGVVPVDLPDGGVQTRLVYAGFGRLSDVSAERDDMGDIIEPGVDIKDAYVLVEAGAREHWLYLIDLGAAGIIFVENAEQRPPMAANQNYQTLSHQDVPRFWMSRAEAQPLIDAVKQGEMDVTIHSETRWERRSPGLEEDDVREFVRELYAEHGRDIAEELAAELREDLADIVEEHQEEREDDTGASEEEQVALDLLETGEYDQMTIDAGNRIVSVLKRRLVGRLDGPVTESLQGAPTEGPKHNIVAEIVEEFSYRIFNRFVVAAIEEVVEASSAGLTDREGWAQELTEFVDQRLGRRLGKQLAARVSDDIQEGRMYDLVFGLMDQDLLAQPGGKNIWIDIPGVSAAAHNKDEIVVIESYYDSMSFAPSKAPGAEQACGIAGLIELGNIVKEFRFEKTVRLLACSGHHQGLEGARRYAWNMAGQYESPMRDVSPMGHAAFMGLDLSSNSERVGMFFTGHFYQQMPNNLKPRLADLGKRAADYVKGREDYRLTVDGENTTRDLVGIAQALDWEADMVFVDTINPVAGKDWPTYLPIPVAMDHEAALLAGIPSFSFTTTNDSRFFSATPEDVYSRADPLTGEERVFVNADNLAKQVKLLACLLPNAFNVEGRYVKRSLPRSICEIRGRAVTFDPEESYLPDKPLPEAALEDSPGAEMDRALIYARPQGVEPPLYGGVFTRLVTSSNQEGEFIFVGMPTQDEVWPHLCTYSFEPYFVEESTITWAPDFGQMGKESYPLTLIPVQKHMEMMAVSFPCETLEVYHLVDPRNYNYLVQLTVLEGQSNSAPPVYGTTLVEPIWQSYAAPTVTLFAPRDTRLKLTAAAGPLQLRVVLLNVAEGTAEGELLNVGDGFDIGENPQVHHVYLQAARDMWRLNDSRIRFFGGHGIRNDRVNQLHAWSREALDNAEQALEDQDYVAYFGEARRALSLESRAYPDVVGMANDVVRGLVFYLALLLPFAFTMERLFLAGRRIETRIFGVSAFFAGMFFLLYLTHPAFKIVLSPWIILLGFIVATLSVIVISIVMGKLEQLVSQRKQETEGEHESGIQATSGFALALEMGIANMRRRKARTLLTSITLIILTFSVLSFASVSAQIRLQKYHYDEGARPYEGVLLRTRNWEPFPFETYASLRNELEDICTLAPRVWYYGHLTLNQSAVEIQMGTVMRTLRALVGLSAQEQEFMDVQSALIGSSKWLSRAQPGEEPPAELLLPVNLAADFATDVLDRDTQRRVVDSLMGANVRLFGENLEVVGFFDSEMLRDVLDESGEVIEVFDGSDLDDIDLGETDDALTLATTALLAPAATPEEGSLQVESGDYEFAMSGGLVASSAMRGAIVAEGRLPQAANEVALPLTAALNIAGDAVTDAMIGQELTFIGRDFKLAGVFDWERMNDLVDIDGEKLTPYDPVQMEKKAQEEGVQDPEEIQRYIHHSWKDVAIVPEGMLLNLGGQVRSIAIRVDPDRRERPEMAGMTDTEVLENLLEGMVNRLDYILFANLDDPEEGARRTDQPMLMSSRKATRISDLWNLIILMVIAGLIVFNTMLGSVFERTKEIGTYTALGIAPSHIGRLFLVEATVFAIIGVMAGYVLGQGVARLVQFTELPVLSTLNLNYSSLAGVGSCVLVMVMTVLSSFYPSRKATELGVPDIERRWKLPATKEAGVTINLPFTVSHYEAAGLVTFLKEYLDSHVDVSVGSFYVENVDAGPHIGGEDATGVTGQFWLTPFDLGVSQWTTFILRPIEGMDVCGVDVKIERLSGDAGSWRRANGHFMTDMRKQFLIWRNLTPQARVEYTQRGQEYALA